jgi:hypothetical protein
MGCKDSKETTMEQQATTERPEGLEDDHLEYLDDLRESGATSMFGARPWLAKAFGLDSETAGKYLAYWMRTFGERHS